MDDLDAIKSDSGVLRVYNRYTSLKKIGDKWTGICPLHSEKSPSFTVYPDMRFQCFGCGKANNIFFLVQEMDGCDFKTAVETVKSEIGNWSEVKSRVENTFKPVAENKTYKTIPLSSWGKMEDALKSSQAAITYLQEQRGISLETAQRLRIGFVQDVSNLAGLEGRDIANKGWLAFPSIEKDKVTGVKYRSLVRKKPGGYCRQSGFATGLFNSEAVDPFEPIYVVEGEFDCLALEQAGFRAVSVPSAGVKLSPSQKDLLMNASMVVLAGDNDSTGNGYMRKLWAELQSNTYLLEWPEGIKDANELLLKDPSSFRTTVEELTQKAKSTPMPDIYSLQETMRNGDDNTLADRPDRLRFPWPEVDTAAILLPGSVCGVMATSTSMGKTALTLQFSLFGARKHNEVVVNWQCELSPSEISVMVAAQVLKKNRNFITKEDLAAAADQLEGVQYYVGNNSSVNNIMEVLDIMEAAIRRLGATQAVLDNAHFYTSGVDDDVRVLASAMKRIKQIAVTYGVKFIVVFQPRKASQAARGKKTQISDVKGSATAGDTCDAVVAIHRDLNKEDGKVDIYEEKTLVEWLKTRSKGVGKSSSFIRFFGEFAEFYALENNYEDPSVGQT